MDDDHQFQPPNPAGISALLTPGAKLRAARERKRLSERELADQTRLPLATILALEADDFSELVEPVYVKGYYRKCAATLGIDANELINAYRAPQPRRSLGDTRVPLSLSSEGDDTASNRDNRLPVMLATLAVIGGIVGWYVYDQHRARALVLAGPAELTEVSRNANATTSPPPAVSDGVNLRSVVPLEAAVVDALPTAGSTPAESDGGEAPVPGEAATAEPASPTAATATAAPDATPAAGQASLQLRVSSNSWTRIEAADGKVLVNRVLAGGEALNLQGTPPLMVVLGNGPGVSLSYNGAPVDFSAHVSSTATARFRLPLGVD